MVTLFRELEFPLWCIFDGLRASRYSWTECYALARDLIVSPDLSVFRTQSNDVSEFSQTVTYRDILQLWSRNRLLQVSPREYSLPLYEYFSGRSSESFGALVWFTLLGNPRDTIEADAALAFDERQAIPSADSSVLSESVRLSLRVFDGADLLHSLWCRSPSSASFWSDPFPIARARSSVPPSFSGSRSLFLHSGVPHGRGDFV